MEGKMRMMEGVWMEGGGVDGRKGKDEGIEGRVGKWMKRWERWIRMRGR